MEYIIIKSKCNIYIRKNIDKINWDNLSLNPNAIDLLDKNQDKINWNFISSNPNSKHILEKNIDKIYWNYLLLNQSIFELDYKALKERCHIYMKELIQKALHPNIIQIYLNLELDIEDF